MNPARPLRPKFADSSFPRPAAPPVRSAWRLIFWSVAVWALAACAPGGWGGECLAEDARPNVIVILSDDQGWGDLSVHGNTNLSTPRIDSLARDGARFDRFFVCPVCSPTRAELLTGRYHPRGGVYSTSAGGERLDLDERTIADAFRAAGYSTAAFGKWHNGMQPPYHPNSRGFDHYYGFCSGHWGDYFSPLLERNGELVRGDGFVIDDFTEQAMQFIRQHRERPFFVYLPYNTPHSPMQAPDEFWRRFADKPLAMRHREPDKEDIPHTRAALAMCENIDWNVGRLLDQLDSLKLSDNTIVLYFCDNGPNGSRWNGGMKGRKGSTDEGVRSPLLIRWPGRIPAGRLVRPIAGAIDLLPTLADLCDVPLPADGKPLDGVSLKPLLTESDSPGDWPDRLIFSHWRGRVSVRSQRFRLDHQGRLYDLQADPGQRVDMTDEHPQVTSRLRKAVAAWREELLPGLEQDDRPFPLGHPDAIWTQLPARDGVAHGGIRRSNRFPNCSYYTHWTSTEDQITWDVEVGAAGRYEVEMYYACPANSLGAELELRVGEAVVRAKVTQAHDPPARGQEHDRTPRVESYIKDFRPMALGVIQLEPGRTTATLRATAIPGVQAAEFRLLMFKRLVD